MIASPSVCWVFDIMIFGLEALQSWLGQERKGEGERIQGLSLCNSLLHCCVSIKGLTGLHFILPLSLVQRERERMMMRTILIPLTWGGLGVEESTRVCVRSSTEWASLQVLLRMQAQSWVTAELQRRWRERVAEASRQSTTSSSLCKVQKEGY